MTPEIQLKVSQYVKMFSYENVLEIGSQDINGTVRPFFNTDKYLGIDMQPGKGVDMVLNSHDLKEFFGPREFDTVLALETFEHDDAFWITLEQINYVLKPNGHLIISTPGIHFRYHAYPKDYYRFTKDTYRDVFFKDYSLLDLSDVKDTIMQPGIIGLGQKI